MATLPRPRAGWLGAVLLVCAMTLPVLFLTTPPLIDVLGHMGRYELQTGLARQPFLQTFYSFHWQVIGNLGADLLVQALQPLLGVVGAARFAVVLVPILAATGVLLIARPVNEANIAQVAAYLKTCRKLRTFTLYDHNGAQRQDVYSRCGGA